MPATEDGKELLEMQLLAAVGDINNFIRLPLFEPVLEPRDATHLGLRRATAAPYNCSMSARIPAPAAQNTNCAFTRACARCSAELCHDPLTAPIEKHKSE